MTEMPSCNRQEAIGIHSSQEEAIDKMSLQNMSNITVIPGRDRDCGFYYEPSHEPNFVLETYKSECVQNKATHSLIMQSRSDLPSGLTPAISKPRLNW